MNPTVLIFRTDLLPPSETFVAAQAHALRRFSPCFAGLGFVPAGLPIDSCESVVLTRGHSLTEKLRRRLFLYTGIAPQFVRALDRRRPVLMHAHFAPDAATALPLVRDLRIPLLVTLHGYDATSSDKALRLALAGRVFLHRRTQLFARAAMFVCVSEHIRQQALAHGFPSAKLRTLPIGVDLDFFAPDPMHSRSLDPIVLFVGRLVEKKGCAHLIRAMVEVERLHPAAKLLIVGDGPLLDPLRLQARALLRQCTFLGSQPPSVVRNLMQRASLLVAPSIVAASGDTEGLPITLCEAQAMALPVAGFHGPGISEAVVHNQTALLVPPGDDAALAEAIHTLLADGNLASDLGAAGRRRAEARFSLVQQTACLEDLYAQLVS
jgi:glycosyltransferase involved in cell wall biosynthesis